MATREVIRFAFVGCGGIARHHLRALQAANHDTVVSAVVDTRQNNAEEFIQLLPQAKACKVFTSLQDCLSWGNFDAAVLMVPHYLHESYSTSCLRNGKHVLLEKPLAHTLESCHRLLEEATKSSAVFMVGEQSPHWPEVVRAKELIQSTSGVIGKPYFALANYWEAVGFSTFLDEAHFFTGGNWRFDPDKAGGGLLMDGATHWIRPLTTWFGDVSEVVGTLGYPLKQSRCETLTHTLIKFQSGLTSALYTHFNSIPMSPLPFFQIFGDEGEITIDGSFDGGMSYRNRDNPEGIHLGSLGGFTSAFAPQMEIFLDAIVGGNQVPESAQQALQEVLFAQAVYRSVKSKQWETIQPRKD